VGVIETFERTLEALPHEDAFRDVEVVDRRARRNGRVTALTAVVDRPSGADLQLCERVAARLNAQLDSETEPYTLEVETPGLDRPLLRPGDYDRFRDHAVRVVTTLAIAGAKTHRGILTGVRAGSLVLQQPSGEFLIPLEMVKHANLEFDPRADLRREKRERKDRRCR
jgi:ribosome maturation factor RimP